MDGTINKDIDKLTVVATSVGSVIRTARTFSLSGYTTLHAIAKADNANSVYVAVNPVGGSQKYVYFNTFESEVSVSIASESSRYAVGEIGANSNKGGYVKAVWLE